MANPFSFRSLQRAADQRQPKRRTVYKTDDKGQLVKTSLLEPKQRPKRNLLGALFDTWAILVRAMFGR